MQAQLTHWSTSAQSIGLLVEYNFFAYLHINLQTGMAPQIVPSLVSSIGNIPVGFLALNSLLWSCSSSTSSNSNLHPSTWVSTWTIFIWYELDPSLVTYIFPSTFPPAAFAPPAAPLPPSYSSKALSKWVILYFNFLFSASSLSKSSLGTTDALPDPPAAAISHAF